MQKTATSPGPARPAKRTAKRPVTQSVKRAVTKAAKQPVVRPSARRRQSPSAAPAARESRRTQMLLATLEVIAERGLPDTRIADVAKRVGVSPALVIYYFKTRDDLLAEAMRYSEDVWYAEMASRTERLETAAERLEEVVAMTCLPDGDAFEASWAVWLDLWAQSLRDPRIGMVRREFDEHFRETIRQIVGEGVEAGEFTTIDADDFANTYSALLDGLAIQIALEDPVVGTETAFRLAMESASRQLGFPWPSRRRRGTRSRAG